jgi:DNA-binding SARP family transcriptional activator/tetratricopeptide (TPR) repeat protein
MIDAEPEHLSSDGRCRLPTGVVMRHDPSEGKEFGILGPLLININGSNLPISAAKIRIILATLLLRPDRFVSVDQLVENLWGDERSPKNPRNALHKYVNRLRNALGTARELIHTYPVAGYRIEVSPDAVDLERFRGYVLQAQQARASGNRHSEAHLLSAGIALWRGRALADVPSYSLQTYEAPRLTEEYLQAIERRADVDLHLGRHADLVAELYGLTAEHPLRERFWCQLMLALYRSNRQSEALSAYTQVCGRLRDELGVDPGEQLRALHQQILNSDPALTVPHPSPVDVASRWVKPLQLPPEIPGFVSRDDLVDKVQAATVPPDPGSHAVPVVILAGPPGAGKTALAIHVAHRLRSAFPDGQLYANLRGYSSSPPVAASEVLERFLRGLGLLPELIPRDFDESSALLRSMLNGRRVLMVLDNARSAEQVRPLLPGSATCAVIVTSRDNLHSLSALNGARRVPVGTVSPDEAVTILACVLGQGQVAAEREAAEALAAACDHLPLALRVVAANLGAYPEPSIAGAVHQLTHGNRLVAMRVDGDDQANVRHAIDLSYRALSSESALLFRLLSLAPGADFDRYAVANLADITADDAQRLLAGLAASNLIRDAGPGRFQFHDLIRDYAREQVRHDSQDLRWRAYRRLFDFYVVATDAACQLRYPDLHPALAAPPPGSGLQLPHWESSHAAERWLASEIDNIVAVACERSEEAARVPVWQLASASLSHFLRQRCDSAWNAVFRAGLDAAERDNEVAAMAAMRRGRGYLSYLGTDYRRAREYFSSSLRLFRKLGDGTEQARVLHGLASVAAETGEYAEAVSYHEQTLALLGDRGTVASRATAMLSMGTVLQLIGNSDRALRHLTDARALAEQAALEQIRTRVDAVVALHHMWCGRLDDALTGFGEVLSVWRRRRFRQGIAETLRNMAEAHLEAERLPEGLAHAQEALSIADEVGHAWAVIGSTATLGIIHLRSGDTARAVEHLARARDLARAGLRHWYALATLGLAEYHRGCGELSMAARLAKEISSDVRPRIRGRAHAEHARAALALTRPEASAHHAGQARRIAVATGYRLDEAHATLALAEAYRQRGDPTNAREHLRRAQRIFHERSHPAAAAVQRLIDGFG